MATSTARYGFVVFASFLLASSSFALCPENCTCFLNHIGAAVRCNYISMKIIPRQTILNSTVVLDLRFNEIERITKADLKGLENLQTVLLRNNKIGEIEPDAFLELRNLRYLYLQDNRLRKIGPKTFSGLSSLTQLYLQNNRIESISRDAFRDQQLLQRLYLQGNQIRQIEEGTFAPLSSLSKILLSRNRLVCNCDLFWLSKFLRKLKATLEQPSCSSPISLSGKPLRSLKAPDLNCTLPHFVKTPLDIVISSRPPSRAYFYCKAVGYPTPGIMWLKNRARLHPNEHYVILEDGTLEIIQPNKDDVATYRCLARNSVGQNMASARLIYYEEEVAPRFIDVPENTQVVEGNAVMLKCSSQGIPNPIIIWSRNGHRLFPSSRIRFLKSGALQISAAHRRDHGQYTCRAQNKVGYVTRTATLIIKTTPVFSVKPHEETRVLEGRTASLPCRADGYPTPAMTWFKDGERLPTEDRHVVLSTGSLRILFVKARDQGVYTCQAINVIGVRTARTTLVVTPRAKPEILSISEDKLVIVGDLVTLSCVAKGDPKPLISWVKDDIHLTNGNRFVVNPSGELTIRDIGKNDEGSYRCVARNDIGSHSKEVRVVVRASRNGPGDKFVNSSILKARETVDRAIQTTIQRLFATSRPRSPSDLLALFRFPNKKAIEIARAAEVFERTIQLIHENVEKGKMLNISEITYNYYDLVSPSYLEMIANLSGCTQHRRIVNCSANICFHKKYRSIDGTCNNLGKPMWGASLTAFRRLLKPLYENGFNTPMGWRNRDSLPSARLISTEVISTTNNTEDESFTHILMQWGQFLDHDLDFTVASPSHQRFTDGLGCTNTCENQSPCFPITIPPGDKRIKTHKCMTFTRSSSACGTGTTSVFFSVVSTREQMNQITSYLDASNVYGSSEEDAEDLRDKETGYGLLKTGISRYGRPFLPFNKDTPIECLKSEKESPIPCFLAGDHRANEQLGLLSMHTIWMREHNRIARQLHSINPGWDDDKIYQETRKIVGAEMQHITYEHYLPKILGKDGIKILGKYEGYNPTVDPSIFNGFATAAYRFGHSLINPVLRRLNESFETIEQGDIPLHKAFFAPYRLVEEGGIDPILRGLFASPAKSRRVLQDGVLNTELTERLFEMAHAVALDLGALNIQRSRDHGLPGYNEWRVLCNLPRLTTFEDLSSVITNSEVVEKLKRLYGDVDKIDLWVGGILEELVPGSLLGPTLQCLIATQFKNLRDGDRFWYENPAVFEDAQITQLKRVTLGRVLCDNGDKIVRVQPDVFLRVHHVSGYESCSAQPSVDLRFWKECCEGSCSDPDKTYTLSRDTNDIKRTKRSSSVSKKETKSNEFLVLNDKIGQLREDVASHKKSLQSITQKLNELEQKENNVKCVDHLGNPRDVNEKWQVNPCKTCVCKKTTAECETQVCPKTTCKNPQKSERSCCPTC